MMQDHENKGIDGTRRCLFPSEDSAVPGKGKLRKDVFEDPSSDAEYSHRDKLSSPTGVSEYLDMTREPLKSTIVMSEDGAEVTLSMSRLSLVTPTKPAQECTRHRRTPLHKGTVLGDVRQNSLFDAEHTPTPPAFKKSGRFRRKDSFTDALCCNSYSFATEEDEIQYTTHKIETAISDILGTDPSPEKTDQFGGCTDWQFWHCGSPSKTSQVEDHTIETLRFKLQNRVLNKRSRSKRVLQLRRDLNPFGKSPNRNEVRLMKSRSFSVADHSSAIIRQSKDPVRHRSGLSNVLQICSVPENTKSISPIFLRTDKSYDRNDVQYDSDPEDFTVRRSSPKVMNKENKPLYMYPTSISMSDPLDEFAFRSIVQEFLNQTSTLVYHTTKKFPDGTRQASRQIAVDAWCERGQRLDEIIQPKWTWKMKPPVKSTGPIVQNGKIQSIELLEITRIFRIDQVDRELYPFAKSQNCFVIRNIKKQDFCFEAKSWEDRDRIVYSLKLAVARFGAMVLGNDDDIYDEFFVSESCVPGRPPRMFEILHDSESEGSEVHASDDFDEEPFVSQCTR